MPTNLLEDAEKLGILDIDVVGGQFSQETIKDAIEATNRLNLRLDKKIIVKKLHEEQYYNRQTTSFDKQQLQHDFENAIIYAMKRKKERFDNHNTIIAMSIIDEGGVDTKIVSNLQNLVKGISLKACETIGVQQTNLDIFDFKTKSGKVFTAVEIVFIKPVNKINTKSESIIKRAKRMPLIKRIFRAIKREMAISKNKEILYK
jgi:hypothetical protein